jgi:glycerol-3-phosphate cytidylyltransferase-like family protein
MDIVAALRCVDEVFLEEALELKRDYLIRHQASILAMGDDWAGKFDEFTDICRVVYFDRTPSVSTTAVIEKIRL